MDKIIELYTKYGSDQYPISEPITQIEHAIQTYEQMRDISPNKYELQLAALLHDIGHFLEEPIDPGVTKVDDKHEEIGANFLKSLGFSDEVVCPIRLHVLTKRYLCTVSPDVRSNLSYGSQLSLELQGGLLSNDEIVAFKRNRFFDDAVTLRMCDDNGKRSDNDRTIGKFIEILKELVDKLRISFKYEQSEQC
jgi:putative nucleotidyltransferase with HDIG domain